MHFRHFLSVVKLITGCANFHNAHVIWGKCHSGVKKNRSGIHKAIWNPWLLSPSSLLHLRKDVFESSIIVHQTSVMSLMCCQLFFLPTFMSNIVIFPDPCMLLTEFLCCPDHVCWFWPQCWIWLIGGANSDIMFCSTGCWEVTHGNGYFFFQGQTGRHDEVRSVKTPCVLHSLSGLFTFGSKKARDEVRPSSRQGHVQVLGCVMCALSARDGYIDKKNEVNTKAITLNLMYV